MQTVTDDILGIDPPAPPAIPAAPTREELDREAAEEAEEARKRAARGTNKSKNIKAGEQELSAPARKDLLGG